MRWLLRESATEAFSAAEDPRLCGAAHASLLLEAYTAVLVFVCLALLTCRRDVRADDAKPLCLFWVVACGAAWWLAPVAQTNGWVPQRAAAALSALQAVVALAALLLFLVLHCRGGAAAEAVAALRPSGTAGAAAAVLVDAEASAAPAALGAAAWVPAFAAGTAAEHQLTDQLQAAYEMRAQEVRRGFLREHAEVGRHGRSSALRFAQLPPRRGRH